MGPHDDSLCLITSRVLDSLPLSWILGSLTAMVTSLGHDLLRLVTSRCLNRYHWQLDIAFEQYAITFRHDIGSRQDLWHWKANLIASPLMGLELENLGYYKRWSFLRWVSSLSIYQVTYHWTERRRTIMCRASFNHKSLRWICKILKEASEAKGNVVRRWKKQEYFSQLFFARNFNKGRYISIINIQGNNRAVLKVPERTWPAKLDKLIYYRATRQYIRISEWPTEKYLCRDCQDE